MKSTTATNMCSCSICAKAPAIYRSGSQHQQQQQKQQWQQQNQHQEYHQQQQEHEQQQLRPLHHNNRIDDSLFVSSRMLQPQLSSSSFSSSSVVRVATRLYSSTKQHMNQAKQEHYFQIKRQRTIQQEQQKHDNTRTHTTEFNSAYDYDCDFDNDDSMDDSSRSNKAAIRIVENNYYNDYGMHISTNTCTCNHKKHLRYDGVCRVNSSWIFLPVFGQNCRSCYQEVQKPEQVKQQQEEKDKGENRSQHSSSSIHHSSYYSPFDSRGCSGTRIIRKNNKFHHRFQNHFHFLAWRKLKIGVILLKLLLLMVFFAPVVLSAVVGVFEEVDGTNTTDSTGTSTNTNTTNSTTISNNFYYMTCSNTLQRSDLDLDLRITRGEFANFISALSDQTISLLNSGATTPTSAITAAYLSYEDSTQRSMPLLTKSSVSTFCSDIYNGMLQYFQSTNNITSDDEDSITASSCIKALQVADTSPQNGRLLPDPEFIPFVLALVPRTALEVPVLATASSSSTTTFNELPTLVQDSFIEMSIDGEIRGPQGQDYLLQFCTRVAVAVAMEAKRGSLIINSKVPTPSPTTTVTTVPTTTVDTFASCKNILGNVDEDNDDVLDSNEYVVFVRGLLLLLSSSNVNSSILLDIIDEVNTNFSELPTILQTNYERLSGSYGSQPPSLYGTKPGQVSTVLQNIDLKILCSDTSSAIDTTIELLLTQTTKSPTFSPVVVTSSPSSQPQTSPTSRLTASPTSNKIPDDDNNNNEDEEDDDKFKRCKTSMVVSDLNNDNALSTDEYVRFLNRVTAFRYYNNSVLYVELDPIFHTAYTNHVDQNLGILDITGSRPMDSTSSNSEIITDNSDSTNIALPPADVDQQQQQQQDHLRNFCNAVDAAVFQYQKSINETIATEPPTSDDINEDDDNDNNDDDDVPPNITDEQLLLCQSALTKANNNSDTFLQQIEYVEFLKYYMTLPSWTTYFGHFDVNELTVFKNLPKSIQNNYKSLILDGDKFVDITDADRIIISSSTATPTKQTSNVMKVPHFQVVCQKTFETLWYYINYPNTTDADYDPISLSPKEKSCIDIIHISDVNSDNILDQAEYAQFVYNAVPVWNFSESTIASISKLLPSTTSTLTAPRDEENQKSLSVLFLDLPYSLQENYDWVRSSNKNNAFRVDGASVISILNNSAMFLSNTTNTTTNSTPSTGEILQLRWVCGRTESVLENLSVPSANNKSMVPSNSTTAATNGNSSGISIKDSLLDHCKKSLAVADINSDLLLTRDEYFQFVRRYTSSGWYGMDYDLLDDDLRQVFEGVANSTGGLLFVEGVNADDPSTTDQDAVFDSFCNQFESAIRKQYTDEAFFERCIISLEMADRNNDSKLNESEYVQFIRDLDAALAKDSITKEYTSYASIGTAFKLNFKLILQNKKQVDLYQLDSISSTTFEVMQRFREICDSTGEALLSQQPVQFETGATVYNAFLTGNTIGLTASDLLNGVRRQELEATYRAFIDDTVSNATSTRRSLRVRRQLYIVGYDSNSVSIDAIENTACPADKPSYQCQVVDGSFRLLMNDEDDPGSVADDFSSRMQVAINNGKLQEKLLSITVGSPIVILGSSTAATNGDQNEDSNGVRIAIIVLATFIMTAALVIISWYCIRKWKRDRVHDSADAFSNQPVQSDTGANYSFRPSKTTSDTEHLKETPSSPNVSSTANDNRKSTSQFQNKTPKPTSIPTDISEGSDHQSNVIVDDSGIGEFRTIRALNSSLNPVAVKRNNNETSGFEIEDFTSSSLPAGFEIVDFTSPNILELESGYNADAPGSPRLDVGEKDDTRKETYIESVSKSISAVVEQCSNSSAVEHQPEKETEVFIISDSVINLAMQASESDKPADGLEESSHSNVTSNGTNMTYSADMSSSLPLEPKMEVPELLLDPSHNNENEESASCENPRQNDVVAEGTCANDVAIVTSDGADVASCRIATVGDDAVLTASPSKEVENTSSTAIFPNAENIKSDENDDDDDDDDDEDESEESDFELEVDLASGTVVETTGINANRNRYRSQIEDLMQVACPDNLENIEDLMDQFAGKEEELIETLKNMMVISDEDDSSDTDNAGDVERTNREKYRPIIESLMKEAYADDLDNIDDLMDQFAGREEELIETLKNMSQAHNKDESHDDIDDGERYSVLDNDIKENKKELEGNKNDKEETKNEVEEIKEVKKNKVNIEERNTKMNTNKSDKKGTIESKESDSEEDTNSDDVEASDEGDNRKDNIKKKDFKDKVSESSDNKESDMKKQVPTKISEASTSSDEESDGSNDSDDRNPPKKMVNEEDKKKKASDKDNDDSDVKRKNFKKEVAKIKAEDSSSGDEDSDESNEKRTDVKKLDIKKNAADSSDSEEENDNRKYVKKEFEKRQAADLSSNGEESDEDSDDSDVKKKDVKKPVVKKVDEHSDDSDEESDDSDDKKKDVRKLVGQKKVDEGSEDSDEDSDESDVKKKNVKKPISKKKGNDDSDDTDEESDDSEIKKKDVRKPVAKKKVQEDSDDSDEDSDESDVKKKDLKKLAAKKKVDDSDDSDEDSDESDVQRKEVKKPVVKKKVDDDSESDEDSDDSDDSEDSDDSDVKKKNVKKPVAQRKAVDSSSSDDSDESDDS